MSRRVQRVAYHLDTKGIRSLPPKEVRMILRGADDLIMRGGRHLLTLILKGSQAKEVLTRSLDQSPAHGFYRNLSAEEVLARVDWVIRPATWRSNMITGCPCWSLRRKDGRSRRRPWRTSISATSTRRSVQASSRST